MTSRAPSPREGRRVPSTARLLLGGALVLGLGATLVLVFSDDARFLKLGIVAALWAALVGAFLAARFRRQVTDKTDNSAELRAIYELELEREIAARREYELELEADAKRKAEEQSSNEIAALRTELGALRETLQGLLGGEVLVERLALQATRMRSLGDEAPQISRQSQVKRLSPSQSSGSVSREQVIIPAEQTELMDRVPADRQAPRRPPTQRQQPQRPAAREAQRPQERPVRQQSRPLTREERVDPADPGSGWWEPVVQPGQTTPPRQDVYQRPLAGDSARSLGEGIDPNWTPSWERQAAAPQQPQQPQQPPQPPVQPGRPPRPPKGQQSQPLPRPEAETRVQAPIPADPPTRVQPMSPAAAETRVQPMRPAMSPSASQTRVQPVKPPENRMPPPAAPRSQPSAEMPVPMVPAAAETRVQPSIQTRVPESRVVDTPLPPPPPPADSGGRRRAEETGGRRRAVEEPGTSTGGRRRRPDDVPSWQDSMSSARNTGSHAKPVAPPPPTGSHAEGKSVSELLAAYGNADSPRRRRRRDDD